MRKSAELARSPELVRRWFCREMRARGHSWDTGIQHTAQRDWSQPAVYLAAAGKTMIKFKIWRCDTRHKEGYFAL